MSALMDVYATDETDLPDLAKYRSPLEWSATRKAFTTWLSCMITLFTAYSPGSYSPPSAQMSEKWNVSHVAILVGITTYTAGFAIAPLFLAPFSELNGRRPVFIATGLLFVVCQLCSALTETYNGMLLARLFGGVGASTFSTMVGGVVSDIYKKEGKHYRVTLRFRHYLAENTLRILDLDSAVSALRVVISFFASTSQGKQT